MRPFPRWASLPVFFTLLGLSTSASAATVLTLEDFEASLLPGVGDVSLDGGAVGTGPLQGSSQALLTTSLAGGAVSEAGVENAYENGTFADDVSNNPISSTWKKLLRNAGASGNGSGPAEGSALQITFAAEAGDTFLFDYDFLTNEVTRDPYTYTDFAWYELDRPTGSDVNGVFAHANQGGLSAFGGPDYEHHTGTQTLSLGIATTGTYTITVGVNDVEDSFRESALVIDWIRLVKGPEPGTFGTVALGLVGLQLYARRRRRTPR